MIDDPIVTEVRNARDAYARRFNYDLDAICKNLQQKQAQSGRRVVTFSPRRLNPNAAARTSPPPQRGWMP